MDAFAATLVTRVFSIQKDGADLGPVHAVHHDAQAWCGRRAQFRHRTRSGDGSVVTCPTCVRALDRRRPYARRSRR